MLPCSVRPAVGNTALGRIAAHCNVLLTERPDETAKSKAPDGAVIAWVGGDPVSTSRVRAAPAETNIETLEAEAHYSQDLKTRVS
jgi:hypothetical protein